MSRVPPTRICLEGLESRVTPALVGGLDPSFGSGGRFSGLATAFTIGGVTVDSDGRTVFTGSVPGPGGSDMLVGRLTPSGTLDPTFGAGGVAVIDFAGGLDEGRGVATDAAGNVVVAGTAGPSGRNMGIARLTPSGTLDSTFGGAGNGTRSIAPGPGFNNLAANDVLIDPTGRVVAVGNSLSAGLRNSMAVVRLTPDGSAIDPGFNGGAVSLISAPFGAGSNSVAHSVVMSGSNLVIGGHTDIGGVGARVRFAAVRLLPGGGLDLGFNGGAVAFNLAATGDDRAFGVATDPAGNVYLAGGNFTIAESRVAVLKLTSNGTRDFSFGSNGVVLTQTGTTFSEGTGVVVQPSGRVVVGGTAQVSVADFDFFVLQLTTAGVLDSGFNSTGSTPGVNRFGFTAGAADFAGDVALGPDGRVVVAGTDNSTGGVRVARVIGTVEKGLRLAAGGSLDGRATTFVPTPAGQYGSPTQTLAGVSPGFAGPVRTAVGDVNGDGIPDTIMVTGPGTPVRVAVVSGADNSTLLVAPFDPFGGDFSGGGFVAAADLDNDGRAEFAVSPDQGGGPRVVIFSWNPDGSTTTRANFFAFTDDPNFRGGVRVAMGDVNGDGTPDLGVAAGFGGGPRIALYNGRTLSGGSPAKLINDFFAFPEDAETLRNGAFIALGDVNGDGAADGIFGGGPGGAPRVFVLSGALLAAGNFSGAYATPVANFFVAGDSNDRGGVRVASTDADGDNRAEVVAGSGEGVPGRVRVYLGRNVTATGEPATFQDLDPFLGVLAQGVFVG